jgi:hypothetical protein
MNFEIVLPLGRSSQTFLLAQSRTGDPAVDKALDDTDKLIKDINTQIDANQQPAVTPGNAVGGITILAIAFAAAFFVGQKFAEGAASRAGEDAYDRITGRKGK